MAKAKKSIRDEALNPNNVANKDVMQRLNFLYQAGVYLNSCLPPTVDHLSSSDQPPIASTSTSGPERPIHNKNVRKRRKMSTTALSQVYVEAMKAIGRKTVVKLDPSVKRTMCKTCGTILIPGRTATVRVKSSSSHGHAVTYSCIQCKTPRRIPAPPVSKSETEGLLAEDDSMIDRETVPDAEKDQVQRHAHTRRKKSVNIARPLPLFQRPGYIVFRGNERVVDEDATA